MLNILYLYNSSQTFTSTVFAHIDSFAANSAHRSFYCHQDQYTAFDVDLSRFDVVVIHYSVRLPFDQLSLSTVQALKTFPGLKALFIQDEYDHTHRAWQWINALGVQLVFTVVPQKGIEQVYPAREFPSTRFISTLTGYVPDELSLNPSATAPSQRRLIIGYRGRPLPIRYGKLGMEKVAIGEIVKSYCDAQRIESDIAWSETSRIYGPRWYEFMRSCRSVLGSESGSNVFDWDGKLDEHITQFRKLNPQVTDGEIYNKLVRPKEIDGIMNQISPRIFEAIAAKTVLVLFDGNYSGVVEPEKHFIPLRKDGSNLPEVLRLLRDGAFVDAIAERAYQDIIASGKYSYQSFVRMVDEEIANLFSAMEHKGDLTLQCSDRDSGNCGQPTLITTSPIRAKPPQPPTDTLINTIYFSNGSADLARRIALYLWRKLPESVRVPFKLRLKQFIE